jgi:TatD DNase family protein
MLVDSHCHLNFPGLIDDIDQILLDMQQARVDRAICISTTMEEYPAVRTLAETHGELWATVGVHPDNEGVEEPTVEALCQEARHPKVVAIGETGLDYYRLGDRTVAEMQWQRDRFDVHIEAARQTGLPLVVHTRSASDDTLSMLRAVSGQVGGVFHCFTETMAVARAALDLGFYISFSGILTFKNAADLREVAAFVPLDRCLVETDSPYLAPVPHRGKSNRPAWVAHVAAELARLQGRSVEEVAEATTRNVERLFPKMALTT